MDLKWLLMRRIVLVALACFIAGSTFTVVAIGHNVKRQNEQLADSVGRQLALQLVRIGTFIDTPQRFPDWDLVTSFVLQPGQCIRFLDVNCSSAQIKDRRRSFSRTRFAPIHYISRRATERDHSSRLYRTSGCEVRKLGIAT